MPTDTALESTLSEKVGSENRIWEDNWDLFSHFYALFFFLKKEKHEQFIGFLISPLTQLQSISLLASCLVAKSGPTLYNPVNCSLPGFPVFYYLPEFAQTHDHYVGDAIQLSHPLSPPSSLPSFALLADITVKNSWKPNPCLIWNIILCQKCLLKSPYALNPSNPSVL